MRRYALVAALVLILAAVFVTVAVYAVRNTETVAWADDDERNVGVLRFDPGPARALAVALLAAAQKAEECEAERND